MQIVPNFLVAATAAYELSLVAYNPCCSFELILIFFFVGTQNISFPVRHEMLRSFRLVKWIKSAEY